MEEVFDIRNYLEATLELGGEEVYFDEPWNLRKRENFPEQTPREKVFQNSNGLYAEPKKTPAENALSQTKGFLNVSPAIEKVFENDDFLKAQSLEEFYEKLFRHSVYKNFGKIVPGSGSQTPAVLLVLDFPQASDFSNGNFFDSPVGMMLLRMFQALSISQESLAMTYLFKSQVSKPVSPLLDSILRSMLEKEVELFNPRALVIFGEGALRQVFGRDKSIRNFAGARASFGRVSATALHDARAMLQNVSLKKETWNIHLPACGLFQKA